MARLAPASVWAVIFLAICIAGSEQSLAQDVSGEFGTGLNLIPPEEFASLPKTPNYRAFLPERIDLSSRFPLPGNQGREGSCSSWAVGYAARAYYAAAAEGRDIHERANIPSPDFLYDSVVRIPGECNSGSSIVDNLNVLTAKGAMSYADFPHNASYCSRPSEAQNKKATDFRIESWLAVDYGDLDQVKGELAKGHPVIIGLKRPKEAFFRLKKGETYVITSDSMSGVNSSGHAVTLVGYDERRQAFKLINSWGQRWGDDGFGWISYDSFRSECREAYVMRPVRPVVPEPNPVVIVKPPPSPVRPPIELVTEATICGKVKVDDDGANTFVTGYVGSDDELTRLSEQANMAKVAVKAKVRPWPQCEVLMTLSKALSDPDRPVVLIENVGKAANTGDYLRFRITTPTYPSFLHVAYLQADGSVVNLIQPDSLELKAYAPSSEVVLGDPDGTGSKFKVQPPYGHEMLVVVASRSPIFDAPHPVQESDRTFLTSLRKAVIAKPDPTSLDRQLGAGFDSIITSDSGVVTTEHSP